MKIGQKIHFHDSDGTMVVETIHDNAPYLESVKQLKAQGIDAMAGNSDCKLVGRVPMYLLAQWIKEAGLKWEQGEEVKDLIRQKMLSGDFSKLRVWQGSY